ncbi:MAG: lysine--tRNA ligase [Dehalococcoidia bacterium]|nr:lysine--tRNA ligase [Dehalococcoidia bacterium]HCV00332.1 lysine--tRNA ligase [Dehalococcoidia bacterium]|tara:strand:- start:347 stop:1888 length:1542 start_codon:yes stop_codon:yes gene_type:complete
MSNTNGTEELEGEATSGTGAGDLRSQRIERAEQLRNAGLEPYPPRIERTHTNAEVEALLEGVASDSETELESVAIAGRVVAQRGMGRASFLDVIDGTGRLQVLLRRNVIGEDAYTRLKLLDLGDFVAVQGTPMRTRTGEATVGATTWQIVTKALRAPPEKFHGLTDLEIRQRQRYLDLLSNEDVRTTFRMRSHIVSAIRRRLDELDYLEVETPVLQEEAGGAAARPFQTHSEALDEERSLRISLELHLKRLLVGGYERVYEIGRIFRNEGFSQRHNPEFTMLELYEAYGDYGTMATLLEDLVSGVAKEVLGTMKVSFGDNEIDFSPPWQRITYHEALRKYGDFDLDQFGETEALRDALRQRGLDTPAEAGRGKLIDIATSSLVEPHLVQPTFLLDYPIELSPLAKRKAGFPDLVERFEAFVGGFEFANAYSELNDPVDQRERFEKQQALRQAGDEEVELADEDFLISLEHGMPPAGGLGFGIDRLVMLLLGHTSIREVILFPQHRKLHKQDEE